MPDTHDFERAWLAKFSHCLEEIAGQEIREAVMEGSAELSSQSDRQEVIRWSQAAMERLDALVTKDQRQLIMTGCACQYPQADLQDLREQYAATGDADLAHSTLQQRFESFLRHTLQLDEALVADIVSRGWGLAGIKTGNRIIATKIPKSGFLLDYMQETDPAKKRQIYCHCPRIRDVLKSSETLSPTYCYCGAGFYKGIWEEILQKPVQVEVLETVLAGAEVCKIAIQLPPDA
jgi:predicted hydrocarbon binding protein